MGTNLGGIGEKRRSSLVCVFSARQEAIGSDSKINYKLKADLTPFLLGLSNSAGATR
jgi:hypothetical protein